jgi:hypothetical protein
VRALINLWLIATVGLVATLPAQGGEPQYREGLMLDAAEYDSCHYDCAPFDRPTLFFCVEAGNQILVGSHKADWKWQYDSSQMLRLQGKQVSLRYNAGSIWLIRTDGKDMHLSRDYSQDVFANPECTAEVHRHWLKQLEPIKRPAAVPPEAVVVPQGPRSTLGRTAPHFWVMCRFDSQSLWDVCNTWDEKGGQLTRLECVDSSNHRAVLQNDLIVDQLTTQRYDEIHLRDGIVLRDWAKARINNRPTPDSRPPLPPYDPPGH